MRHILISFILLLTISGYSQKVTITNATSQTWAGGVAGHHGITYSIELQCSDTNIVPDTAWINGQYYPITINKADTIYRKLNRKHNMVTYNLYEGESYIDNMGSDPMRLISQNNSVTTKEPRPRQYKGVALISYRLHGKQYTILVNSFTRLTPLCYP